MVETIENNDLLLDAIERDKDDLVRRREIRKDIVMTPEKVSYKEYSITATALQAGSFNENEQNFLLTVLMDRAERDTEDVIKEVKRHNFPFDTDALRTILNNLKQKHS